ncbi:MAG: citrate lyase holo-[acyl-carrier protein] synthase [Paludibacteraceae bacterium]|nr:citrate lyase holo-[acyl-carrier protein] synthase [Paludibacteraceae bacterium]
MGVTLAELLAGRDQRRNKQQQLIDTYQLTVVCLTIVMPGSEKRNETSLYVAKVAHEYLLHALGIYIKYTEFNDALTGPEGFYVVDLPAIEAKRLTTEIEDTHPMGRLFDIDVLQSNLVPVMREEVGKESRKCLVCGEKSVDCIRNKKHSLDEVMSKINAIVENYKQKMS